jgi:hypothetical protein
MERHRGPLRSRTCRSACHRLEGNPSGCPYRDDRGRSGHFTRPFSPCVLVCHLPWVPYSPGMVTRKLLLAGIAGMLLGCGKRKTKDCPKCDGGIAPCSHCNGSGKCKSCDGDGRRELTNSDGTSLYEDCQDCDKSGRCKDCEGRGKGKCLECDGAGRFVLCSSCAGTGHNAATNRHCTKCRSEGWAIPTAADE